MTIEDYLVFFKDEGIGIQITLDVDKNPTVHALYTVKDKRNLKMTQEDTLLSALEQMKIEILHEKGE